MEAKVLNLNTLSIKSIIDILNNDGICKVKNNKNMSIEEFCAFCKRFLTIVKLIPNDPEVVRISKDHYLSRIYLPWHPEGSWVEDDIISASYNYLNCEKFPTEFINTNEILNDYCDDINYYKKIKVKLKDSGRFKWNKNNNKKEINVIEKRNQKYYLYINPQYTDEIINDNKSLYKNLIKKFWDREDEIEKYKFTAEVEKNDIIIYHNVKIIHTRPKNLKNVSFDRELWRVTGTINV